MTPQVYNQLSVNYDHGRSAESAPVMRRAAPEAVSRTVRWMGEGERWCRFVGPSSGSVERLALRARSNVAIDGQVIEEGMHVSRVQVAWIRLRRDREEMGGERDMGEDVGRDVTLKN